MQNNNTQRYEIVAPMPHFTHLFKGDILYPKYHTLYGFCWGMEDEDNVSKWVTFCPDYPHLFRPLKWWEHVPIDDLPKYVKWGYGDRTHVAKIDHYEINNHSGNLYAHTVSNELLLLGEQDHPATEAEYNEYLTKLNEDA